MRKRAPLFERRYFRVPYNGTIEFQILKFKRTYITHLSSKYGPGQGHDLGEDGMSFISPYSLPVDLIIRVDFELPDFGRERILARVVRSRQVDSGYLTAVQFLNLHGHRRDTLRSFITSETRKNYRFLKYL